jgi:hypothetical protein
MSITHETPAGWAIGHGRKTDNPFRKMNETVYLFALSVPALLEQIIASQAGPRTPVVVPRRTEKRA